MATNFEISATNTENLEKANFRIFQLKFEFYRKLSSLEVKFLDFIIIRRVTYLPNLLNGFDRELVSNQKKKHYSGSSLNRTRV